MSFKLGFAGLISLSVLHVACGSAEPGITADGEGEEVTTATTVLHAKMYDDRDHVVNASCDHYTDATVLKARSGTLIIQLEQRMSPTSTCELAIFPNTRKYTVRTSDDCGSVVYSGARAGNSVSLTDNRSRLCENVVAAGIVLTESIGGREAYLYGEADVVAPPAATPVLQTKLYLDPRATPSASCDMHTKLTITKEGAKTFAKLETTLSATSTCEIAAVPDPRTYEVTQTESCGSKVYQGRTGADSIRVQDNATRLCEDLRPAKIEVTETRGGSEITTYGR